MWLTCIRPFLCVLPMPPSPVPPPPNYTLWSYIVWCHGEQFCWCYSSGVAACHWTSFSDYWLQCEGDGWHCPKWPEVCSMFLSLPLSLVNPVSCWPQGQPVWSARLAWRSLLQMLNEDSSLRKWSTRQLPPFLLRWTVLLAQASLSSSTSLWYLWLLTTSTSPPWSGPQGGRF